MKAFLKTSQPLLRRGFAQAAGKRYSKDHEWVRHEGGRNYSVGISDYAQHKLGGIVYLSKPDVGKEYKAHDSLAEIESPKAVSSVYAPISLKITDVNEKVHDNLSTINEDAEGTWLFKGEVSADKEVEKLMSEEDYKKYIEKLG